MGNSFVLFDVSIVIPHGQFQRKNRGYTQKSHFPVGKRSSGTATNNGQISSQLTLHLCNQRLCKKRRSPFLFNKKGLGLLCVS